MMPTLYAVLGAGGHGRETMPMVESMVTALLQDSGAEAAYVVEDAYIGTHLATSGAIPLSVFLSAARSRRFTVAIADPVARRRLAGQCVEHGIEPFTICDATAMVRRSARVGVGAILSPYTVVGPDVLIGAFFHGNTHCNIAHDCVIGDFVTMAPGVLCNGHVKIGNNVTVGAGAMIRNGTDGSPLTIGDGAYIGMGSVVLSNVPAGATVVGNPARPIGEDR